MSTEHPRTAAYPTHFRSVSAGDVDIFRELHMLEAGHFALEETSC